MTCKYLDCGWCYAPTGVKTNNSQGECIHPECCPYFKSQMTYKSESEKLKQEIKVLEKKLALLEEMENYKSPVEKSYRDAYGKYPVTDVSMSDWDAVSWSAFQKGYAAAQLKDVGVPECPDEPEYYDEIEHDMSENVENKTLKEVINRWWMDTFTSKNMWSVNECIDDLADQIEFWILRNKNT